MKSQDYIINLLIQNIILLIKKNKLAKNTKNIQIIKFSNN